MTNKTETFAALHQPGNPVVVYNIWDAGSAIAVAKAGARAIATGSYGVAGAHGMGDGEKFPFDLAIANLERIVAVTDLPVSIDLEAGYGPSAADVSASAQRAGEAGAVGINLEDKDPATRELFPVEQACERIAAAAATGMFVNGRCDLFIKAPRESHNDALVEEALERARAYAAAGARSFFAPFLLDGPLIGKLCSASPLPVNILVGANCPSHFELAQLGVARISHGHGPWAAAMDWLTGEAARAIASVAAQDREAGA